MPRKLPPRINLPGEAPDFSRPVNSLKELAEKIGVSTHRLRSWKEFSEEIKKGRPYSVGRCILQLVATGKIPKDKIRSLEQEAQMALVFDVAIDAIEYQGLAETMEAMLDDPAAFDLLLKEKDPSKRRAGIMAIGPIKRKTWNPLEQNEIPTIAVASPKTAALFFDRVWCMDRQAPPDIGLRFGTMEENVCLGLTESLVSSIADATGADDKKLDEVSEKMSSLEVEIALSQMFESMILSPVRRISKRDVSVFSGTQTASDKVFGPGHRMGALAVLDGVPLIDEKSLDWKQVVEIRKDSESRRRLKRFLHWVDTDYANQPISLVRDGLEQKLADFDEATRKHGIERSLGRVSVMLDGSLWLAVASAFDHVLAGLAGITVMGIRAAVTHYQYRLAQSSLENQNPIAYIHELQSRTK